MLTFPHLLDGLFPLFSPPYSHPPTPSTPTLQLHDIHLHRCRFTLSPHDAILSSSPVVSISRLRPAGFAERHQNHPPIMAHRPHLHPPPSNTFIPNPPSHHNSWPMITRCFLAGQVCFSLVFLIAYAGLGCSVVQTVQIQPLRNSQEKRFPVAVGYITSGRYRNTSGMPTLGCVQQF